MLTRSISKRAFSVVSNLHQPPIYYLNGQKQINDYDTEEYRPQIQAFLTKRRTVKREVPAKAWVIKDMGEEYRTTYYQQRLASGEFLYEDSHLKKLYE